MGMETAHRMKSASSWLGILSGLGGATGQAVGLVLAKEGLSGDFPSISASVIRMITAMVFIWVITIFMRQTRDTLQKVFTSFSLVGTIFAGSVVGPFIGVWLSQIAIQNTYVGIASTLMALTPVFMLPVAKWYYKEDGQRSGGVWHSRRPGGSGNYIFIVTASQLRFKQKHPRLYGSRMFDLSRSG